MAASPHLTYLLCACLLACSETNSPGSGAAGSSASMSGAAGGAPNTVAAGGGPSSALTDTTGNASGGEVAATGGALGAGTGLATGTGTGASGSGGSTGSAPGGGAAGQSDSGADAGGMPEPGGLSNFTLAVIGSSTAAGEGASNSSRGWVRLLASELEAAVVGDFVSKNLSVGGYASSDLMPGSSSSGNIDDAIAEAPNLVIVALAGSNDLSNGVSTETFLERLATIRDTAIEAGVPIFFVSTAPKDLDDEAQQTLLEWTNQLRQEFDTCWTPNTPSYAPCFIDVFEALANSSLGIADEYGAGDGIHLNDAGHQRIFEIAASIVRPYVCSVTSCTP